MIERSLIMRTALSLSILPLAALVSNGCRLGGAGTPPSPAVEASERSAPKRVGASSPAAELGQGAREEPREPTQSPEPPSQATLVAALCESDAQGAEAMTRCAKCPAFTSSFPTGGWKPEAVFAAVGSDVQQSWAALQILGCEAPSDGDGGTVLFRLREGKWTAARYVRGLRGDCAAATTEPMLACVRMDTAAGNAHYSVSETHLETGRHRGFFRIVANFHGACTEAGRQSIVSDVSLSVRYVEDDVLEIPLRLAWAPEPPGFESWCGAFIAGKPGKYPELELTEVDTVVRAKRGAFLEGSQLDERWLKWGGIGYLDVVRTDGSGTAGTHNACSAVVDEVMRSLPRVNQLVKQETQDVYVTSLSYPCESCELRQSIGFMSEQRFEAIIDVTVEEGRLSVRDRYLSEELEVSADNRRRVLEACKGAPKNPLY